MEMNRFSFFAGAAVAFVVSAGWYALQSAPVAPAAADQTLGMALMSAGVDAPGTLIRGSGVVSANIFKLGYYDVTFERSVASCAASITAASVNADGPGVDVYGVGYFLPDPRVFRVSLRYQPNDANFPAPFHLLMFCHK